MYASLRSHLGLLALACLLCLALPQSALAEAGGGMLSISNPKTGLSAGLPLNGVQSLAIRFFHSYDRRWVVETFRVCKGRFAPTEVSYGDDSYDYRHQRYKAKAVVGRRQVRLVEIEPMPSDLLKSIATRVAHTKPQQLLIRRKGRVEKHPFDQWGAPGDPLVFRIK